MCKKTTTTFTLCTCRIPSIESCPRCPETGYKHCIDYVSEEEKEKGVCVGLGTCPEKVVNVVVVEAKESEKVEAKDEGVEKRDGAVEKRDEVVEEKRDEAAEKRDEGVGLGNSDWGEIFGLVEMSEMGEFVG
jgi:hypothetical protein